MDGTSIDAAALGIHNAQGIYISTPSYTYTKLGPARLGSWGWAYVLFLSSLFPWVWLMVGSLVGVGVGWC